MKATMFAATMVKETINMLVDEAESSRKRRKKSALCRDREAAQRHDHLVRIVIW